MALITIRREGPITLLGLDRPDKLNALDQFALPNFYFHLVTAYSILRHNGVTLGKIPFVGSLPLS